MQATHVWRRDLVFVGALGYASGSWVIVDFIFCLMFTHPIRQGLKTPSVGAADPAFRPCKQMILTENVAFFVACLNYLGEEDSTSCR